MIIRHDEERGDRNAAMSQLGDDFLNARLGGWGDIVD